MSPELYWLALTTTFTALIWLVYALDRIFRRGLMTAMGNPDVDDTNPYVRGLSAWAQRAYYAHRNAVENLVVFAPLVLIANAANVTSSTTILACKVYFIARLLHFIVYTLGVPVARTLIFAVSWLATLAMASALLV